ncbi:MAG TPA: hypothetical protein VGH19_03165 [Verrucomicrobiae bacterium]
MDLYRIKCTSCDWSAIRTFDGKQYDYIPDGFDKLVLDEKVVQLSGLFASCTLAEHGYTWEKAESENRLVYVSSVICLTCGELSELEINHKELKLAAQNPEKLKSWFKSKSCTHCGSSTFNKPFKAMDKTLPCPKCKTLSVKCNRETTVD